MAAANVPAAKARVRGVILASRRKYVIQRFGEAAWEQVLQSLSPKGREALSGSIRSGGWYPLPLNAELDRAIAARLGGGPRSAYLAMGAFSAEQVLPSAYPFAIAAGDPVAMLRAIRQAGGRHFDPITIVHEEEGPGRYVVTFSGFVSNEANCQSNIGFFTRAVELCGGLDVRVTERSCTITGARADVYEIRWRPGPGPEPAAGTGAPPQVPADPQRIGTSR